MSLICGLCYLFKELDTSVMMKADRMRSLGHFIWMTEAALPQRNVFAESWSHQNQDDWYYDSRSAQQTIWQMLVLETEVSELKTEKMKGKIFKKPPSIQECQSAADNGHGSRTIMYILTARK
jgi:hypothetical protein